MTRQPTSDPSDADASSRRDRLDARRSRRTRMTMAALTAVVLVSALAIAGFALNQDDPRANAALSGGTRAGGFGGGTLVPPNAVKTPAPRALNHEHPLKLWIGGDSLAGSFGPALGDQLGATGIVKTLIDYKVSSGLASNDIRDWYERAKEQMASDDPDAVVFIIGTNDAPIVNGVDANGDHVPDWEADYRLKIARMMDVLVGPSHRTVFWLGPPTLEDDTMNRGAKAIGPVMRAEAARHAPDVEYLDTYKLFATPDGTYSRDILDETGKDITARLSDGVHFTEEGAQYLARAVFTLIDTRWKIEKQADPAQPIGWNWADGAGELVPGFSSRPTSKYQSGNSGGGDESPPASDAPTTFVTTPPTFETPTSVSTPTTSATVPPPTSPPPTSPPSTSPPHVTPTT